ncbi:MAG: four helix bundle protein, partial [Bacteroidales bacterium]|nr:four helix bundle protein [Bacteroidales bacterium]
IIRLYQNLLKNQKEYLLSKQILRSGTSIGANVEEAIGGQTKKDFYAKMAIAYKEARETHYWLRLLSDTGFISQNTRKELLSDIDEILKIIGSIQNTIKKQLETKNLKP